MIYLASPYSHPDPLIRKTRFLLAEEYTAWLLTTEGHVYSPIVHCHAMSLRYSFDFTFDFWKKYNFDMIRRCDRFMILTLPGWDESKGVTAEADFARDCGMEVELRKPSDENNRYFIPGTELYSKPE